MLNPDGVVAGNYRTSLFGKDLNRTFNQSRRFAFPEVYQLLRLGEDLKKRHKNKFCLYLDLHGHSIKKNVFMYGPDYALQDSNYEVCRELPKILGGLTPYFRYYSCSFRISD
jgi:murein tripeptide amidase MpaA